MFKRGDRVIVYCTKTHHEQRKAFECESMQWWGAYKAIVKKVLKEHPGFGKNMLVVLPEVSKDQTCIVYPQQCRKVRK